MKSKLRKLFLLLFLFHFASSQSQNKTPNKVLNDVYVKTQKAKDYSVKVTIKLDLPFIKMLPSDAVVYYKKQDKFKVVSKGITIVPRQGFDQLGTMLSDTNEFTSIKQGTEIIGKTSTSIISIIPIADTSNLILGKLWIDVENALVLRTQVSTKTNGTILADYIYGKQKEYGLPDAMFFTIDIKKFKIPKGLAGETRNSKADDPEIKKNNKKGRIIVELSNYQINKGISDEIFNK